MKPDVLDGNPPVDAFSTLVKERASFPEKLKVLFNRYKFGPFYGSYNSSEEQNKLAVSCGIPWFVI